MKLTSGPRQHNATVLLYRTESRAISQITAALNHKATLGPFNFVSDYNLFLILSLSKKEREECIADSPAAHPCLRSAGAAGGGLIQEPRPS